MVMSNGLPDHTLRRLVADLALANHDDVAAILDVLEPDERQSIETLLAEFYGDSAAVGPPTESVLDQSRLSSWLLEALDDRTAERRMTEHAQGVLRECAVRHFPVEHQDNVRRSRPRSRLAGSFGPRRGSE
jgi:hypothetical protein